jgi:hypothetical protein
MNATLKACLVSAMALATAAPAFGQAYQPTEQYRRDMDQYQNDRARYEASRDQYQARREGYEASRRAYEVRRAEWERARYDYDRRYGYGAYMRLHPVPVWDDAYWSGRTATDYGVNTAYTAVDCNRRSDNGKVVGGLIGALAGAALGSNIAANGRGTEGAVLGAVVGGAAGVAVGGSGRDRVRCDARGPYFSYNDTIAYRESSFDRGRSSGLYNYSYYSRQRCRLAAAPVDYYGQDYRYVRVCPDRDGRYRITG